MIDTASIHTEKKKEMTSRYRSASLIRNRPLEPTKDPRYSYCRLLGGGCFFMSEAPLHPLHASLRCPIGGGAN